MSTEANMALREGKQVEPRRLWFGTITAAVAWILLGITDIVITWRACMVQADYGIPAPHPGARILYGVVAALLLVLSVYAGYVSYRNLRYLSDRSKLMDTHAVPRKEFLAYAGIVITVTMGMGILWLGLLPFFLDLCWRAR